MITNTTRNFLTTIITSFFWLFFRKKYRKYSIGLLIVLLIGFLLPQPMSIPVEGATTADWSPDSFWAYPWGTSITHKGIDIFKERGTPVTAATYGIVVYTHEGGKGGKSVMVLGPKWRFHYYAHLDRVDVFPLKPLAMGSQIGTVGDTGNAKGKPPHLHYAITTPFPYIHLRDTEAVHGWKKMFYLNPDRWFRP
ncbi:M23 family metallopeptidase [Aureisphaera galaxeae]|uniref:M23 family metallopeptidase n=1 Tax=Aureisphaera galaxeae TaxID=1538023 RepID=UPI00234FC64D|nr:M23 family metallopeptidase [Aureisphaera galaxeae]MDC8004811.1 M23 family metallopeptidase [Aureisphaera galaxeae]